MTPFTYVTTSEDAREYSFEHVITHGYPNDFPRTGALFVPKRIPRLTRSTLAEWRRCTYPELVYRVARLFIDRTEIPDDDLRAILMRVPQHVAMKRLDSTPVAVCELFHGPSGAFKDLAMIPALALLHYFLEKAKWKAAVVVATSGDTGPSLVEALKANAEAFRGRLRGFVVFPSGRVSEQQANQMRNPDNARYEDVVRCYEVGGGATSDSLDEVVSRIFSTSEGTAPDIVCSMNSINFARVMLAIPHIFHAYFSCCSATGDDAPLVDFYIPCGALGNASACRLAIEMGLPVRQVVMVNNMNDVTHRFFSEAAGSVVVSSSTSSTTTRTPSVVVVPTISPAMDICVPYNLERIKYWAGYKSPAHPGTLLRLDSGTTTTTTTTTFITSSTTEEQTRECILRVHREWNYIICPHTAVALFQALRASSSRGGRDVTAVVVFATAHPRKFADAITRDAGIEADVLDRVSIESGLSRSIAPCEGRSAAMFVELSHLERVLRSDMISSSNL